MLQAFRSGEFRRATVVELGQVNNINSQSIEDLNEAWRLQLFGNAIDRLFDEAQPGIDALASSVVPAMNCDQVSAFTQCSYGLCTDGQVTILGAEAGDFRCEDTVEIDLRVLVILKNEPRIFLRPFG